MLWIPEQDKWPLYNYLLLRRVKFNLCASDGGKGGRGGVERVRYFFIYSHKFASPRVRASRAKWINTRQRRSFLRALLSLLCLRSRFSKIRNNIIINSNCLFERATLNFNKIDILTSVCTFLNFSRVSAIFRNIWRVLKFVEKFDACMNALCNCSYDRAFFLLAQYKQK